MPAAHLLMSAFKARVSSGLRFSDTPRLTIRQAFAEAGKFMPADSTIIFHKRDDAIAVDIYPFSSAPQVLADTSDGTGQEPTHLSYKFCPAHKSVLIGRMKAENQKSGIGSAMIAAQYPFWQKMGVEMISVSTHEMGDGFYRKLGFLDVTHLPEKPQEDPRYSILLRLDLTKPAQKEIFEKALNKVRPLVQPL